MPGAHMLPPKWGAVAIAAFRLAILLSIPACACAAAATGGIIWWSFVDPLARRGDLRAWTLFTVYECSAIDAFCTSELRATNAFILRAQLRCLGFVAMTHRLDPNRTCCSTACACLSQFAACYTVSLRYHATRIPRACRLVRVQHSGSHQLVN